MHVNDALASKMPCALSTRLWERGSGGQEDNWELNYQPLKLITFAAKLNSKAIIQKLKAAFLLLVFAISITPKTFFHDLIANHKDFSTCKQVHTTAVLHTQGYNCHFDDLVVSMPFLQQPALPVIHLTISYQEKKIVANTPFLSFFSQHKESRGPPFVWSSTHYLNSIPY